MKFSGHDPKKNYGGHHSKSTRETLFKIQSYQITGADFHQKQMIGGHQPKWSEISLQGCWCQGHRGLLCRCRSHEVHVHFLVPSQGRVRPSDRRCPCPGLPPSWQRGCRSPPSQLASFFLYPPLPPLTHTMSHPLVPFTGTHHTNLYAPAPFHLYSFLVFL